MTSMKSRVLAPVRAAALICLALLAGGCATAPGHTTNDDPWIGFNRGVYRFNDTLDRAALKPVAKGYRNITPQWMRSGIGNFMSNLEYPMTVGNQFLQGKVKVGLRDLGRFVLNTTLGLGGLFDVGTQVGLVANDEDLGQTLAVWGVPSGPYLTMPFFGPSSVRDAPTRLVDFFFDPLSYVDVPWESEWGRRVVDAVHSRSELLSLDPTLERTFDPYAFMRDAWVQQRQFNVFDGSPPIDESQLYIEDEEESAPDEE